jgi:hypothetical protein
VSFALPATSVAQAPRNVKDFALAYRVQVYETYRAEREEYAERMKLGEEAMIRYRSAKNAMDRKRVIDWFSQAIVASYPGGGSLPVLPGEGLANTFQDADAIAARGSEFKYNPEFHPLRFNQYSRSPNWESQKPSLPKFNPDAAGSQALADYPIDNVDDETDVDTEKDTKPLPDTDLDKALNSDAEQITTNDNDSSDDELTFTPIQTSEESVQSATVDEPKTDDLKVAAAPLDASPSNTELTIDTPSIDAEPSDPIESTLEIERPDSEVKSTVQAEVDESNADESFETPVNSETPDEVVKTVSPIEINARVAGHNLALAGLEKRTERAFAGNHKDLVNVVERLEQLIDSHIKARLMIESAPELSSKLISLDNIVHLSGEINRQLKSFLHSTSKDIDRETLKQLRARAESVYESTKQL